MSTYFDSCCEHLLLAAVTLKEELVEQKNRSKKAGLAILSAAIRGLDFKCVSIREELTFESSPHLADLGIRGALNFWDRLGASGLEDLQRGQAAQQQSVQSERCIQLLLITSGGQVMQLHPPPSHRACRPGRECGSCSSPEAVFHISNMLPSW